MFSPAEYLLYVQLKIVFKIFKIPSTSVSLFSLKNGLKLMLETGTDVRNSILFPEKDQVWVWVNVRFWQILISSPILDVIVSMPVKAQGHPIQLASILFPESYMEILPNAGCL